MSALQSVKPGLTPKRVRETPEYAAFARRALRAYGRRVAEGDEVDLQEMLLLRIEVEQAIETAVRGQRRAGQSWAYIGLGLGVSRQAAQMRYGHVDREDVP